MKIARISAVCAALALGASAAMADDFPKMNLKYAHFLAENYYQTAADKQFIEAVETGSGGNIKITPFWSRSLGTEKELLALLRNGAVDFGALVTGYFPSELPFTAFTNTLPMVFFDGEKLVDVTREVFKTNPSIQAELEENNLKPLIFRYLPNYRIACREPIRTIEDLKGKRILSYGAFVPIVMDAIGAVPVNMGLPEVYESLSRGALDCSYMHLGGTEFRKWHEVAPYLSDIDFGVINAYVIFMNLDRWNALTDDAKALFEQAAVEASDKAISDMQAADDAGRQAMLADGAEWVEFQGNDALQAQVPDMIEVWIAEREEAGRGDEARALATDVRTRLGE